MSSCWRIDSISTVISSSLVARTPGGTKHASSQSRDAESTLNPTSRLVLERMHGNRRYVKLGPDRPRLGLTARLPRSGRPASPAARCECHAPAVTPRRRAHAREPRAARGSDKVGRGLHKAVHKLQRWLWK